MIFNQKPINRLALLTGALQPHAHTCNNMFKTIDIKMDRGGPGGLLLIVKNKYFGMIVNSHQKQDTGSGPVQFFISIVLNMLLHV